MDTSANRPAKLRPTRGQNGSCEVARECAGGTRTARELRNGEQAARERWAWASEQRGVRARASCGTAAGVLPGYEEGQGRAGARGARAVQGEVQASGSWGRARGQRRGAPRVRWRGVGVARARNKYTGAPAIKRMLCRGG
eukprot:10170488-Alexandrium_andersonii.AAC.1